MAATPTHEFDKAPAGTALVYLATYSASHANDAFDPVIAVLRDADGLDEVARWFGRNIEDGGFGWDAAYLRGPNEPYLRIPEISSVFILAPHNAAADFKWAPISQYAFVDRATAGAHAAWFASRHGWPAVEIRELALDVPLVSSL